MAENLAWEILECVAVVAKGWADDANLPAALRHRSLHLSQLTAGMGRCRQPFPPSLRNVESMFCSMCQRIKAGPCECDAQSLERCPVLQQAAATTDAEFRRATAFPGSVCDLDAYRLGINAKHRQAADESSRIPATVPSRGH